MHPRSETGPQDGIPMARKIRKPFRARRFQRSVALVGAIALSGLAYAALVPTGAEPFAPPGPRTPAEPEPAPPALPEPLPAGLEAVPLAVAQDPDGAGLPTLTLTESQFQRMVFPQDVLTVVLGDEPDDGDRTRDFVSVQLLGPREILLRGKRPGRTNLLLGFEDGTFEEYQVRVEVDISVLRAALLDIHPGIRAEMAPHRAALVLRGEVRTVGQSERAERAASMYLEAGSDRLTGGLREGDLTGLEEQQQRRPEVLRGAVINLLRVQEVPTPLRPMPVDERILEASKTLQGADISVRRIQRGSLPDDAIDVFVLEGSVQNQIELVRLFSLAIKTLGGVRTQTVREQAFFRDENGELRYGPVEREEAIELAGEIVPVADEGGGLAGREAVAGDQRVTSTLLRGIGGVGAGGGRSGVSSAVLRNLLGVNIARAKVVELAGGRILSFVEVRNIPQVRVDIRIYEVNRSALLSYDGELNLLLSDFNQPSLNPAAGATASQGVQAARVGAQSNTDIQNVFGFLNGRFSNQLQVSGSNYAIDSLFRVLEREGLARSLAQPSLTVLSGETAVFEVGGRIPIEDTFATAVEAQGILTAVGFVDFGINLAVRPLVGDRGEVTIDFVPEISTPDAALTSLIVESTGRNPATFAFESRLLRTSARLQDGQTLLVGGLEQRNRTDQNRYTPWLARVPLLGLLFQGLDYSDDDLEVVIMVRPIVLHDPDPEVPLWLFPQGDEVLTSLRASLPGGQGRGPVEPPELVVPVEQEGEQ